MPNLAQLVSQKKRRGVISDGWSYRNRLLVLMRGFSQARGPDQWNKVGRKVQGHPFYIVMPRFGIVEERPKTKRGKPKKRGKPLRRKALMGFLGCQVWGLEQTQPAEDYRTEEKYRPWEGDWNTEYVQVYQGLKVPWYEWYSSIRPDVDDQLTGYLSTAIVAKLTDNPTELDDLLRKLREVEPAEIARRIDPACKAVAAYVAGKKPEEFEAKTRKKGA